jgi:ribonucleoside-diphosphate reductase beta chain
MSLFTPRPTYGPFEYQQAYTYCINQMSAHWIPFEVQMNGDINDYKLKLSDIEKNVIGNVLKGFTQTEIFIQEYWSNKVSKWFKKPEIQMMSATFSSFESIHAIGYSYLEESLGLQNYEGFLHEPTAKAKIDRLMEVKGKTKEEIAKSLAIFSAFNEGVNLFSSFAILMSFSKRNLLKGVGKIVEWSIKDESLHSTAGCWLFRTLVEEFPEILTDEFKKDIYDAARLTVQLEDAFIDKAFELGPLPDLDPKDIKNYIRFRANTKLQDLGFKKNWKSIDQESLKKLEWFDVLASGTVLQDFFAGKETSYSKATVDFSDIWSQNV